MRTFRRSGLDGQIVDLSRTEENASDRAAELHRIAAMSAEEIVTRHDDALIVRRFRAMLAAAEDPSPEARAVAAEYAARAHIWRAPPSPPRDEPSLFDRLIGPHQVFEVSGTVRWFDAAYGYGFIAPDDGGPTILLHIVCLRAGGYQTAVAGARIVCKVIQRPKGRQAVRILHMDTTAASDQPPVEEAERFAVRSPTDWEVHTVKWFNRVRGFGFLDGEAGMDILVTTAVMRRSGIAELRPGQRIEVRWGIGPNRPMAVALRAPRGDRA
jgi:cold shock protein